jgi:hypothetical protein
MKMARQWKSLVEPLLASLLMAFTIVRVLGGEPDGSTLRVELQESDELLTPSI